MTLPQEEFIARASEVLGADDRVRGLWLTGSLGDGTADEFSDVDSLVVVEDSSYDDVLAEWDLAKNSGVRRASPLAGAGQRPA